MENKKKSPLKKIFKVIMIAAGTLIVLGALFIATLELIFSNPYKKLIEEESPNGVYIVRIKETDGEFPFGPAKVKIIAGDNTPFDRLFPDMVYETTINDDGGKGTVTIEWVCSNQADVRLEGSEQDTVIERIIFCDNETIEHQTKVIAESEAE